jgi:hypothetical protein
VDQYEADCEEGFLAPDSAADLWGGRDESEARLPSRERSLQCIVIDWLKEKHITPLIFGCVEYSLIGMRPAMKQGNPRTRAIPIVMHRIHLFKD